LGARGLLRPGFIIFKRLSKDALRDIVEIRIKELQARLDDRRMTLIERNSGSLTRDNFTSDDLISQTVSNFLGNETV
jgi:ABC-type phosphate transport system substrate-binding protein